MAAIISGGVSYFWPENFDFEITRRMNVFQPEGVDAEGHQLTEKPSETDTQSDNKQTADANSIEVSLEKGTGVAHVHNDASDETLYKDFILSVQLTIGLFVLWVESSHNVSVTLIVLVACVYSCLA